MIADFWKPFLFRYAPLQRLPKIIVLYFDLIFFKKWVTSIYNADIGSERFKIHLDNSKHVAYNKDTKSGATDRRLRPQIRLLKDLTALALERRAVISFYMQGLQRTPSQVR